MRTITNLPKSGGNLEVPREFELEQIAGNQDVGSLIAMTFNEFGHMIAASEGGSLLLVYDKDKDGRFDTIREYADSVKNCQGILAMNGNVFVVGTGPQGLGLYRLRDANRDGFLDETKLVLGFKGENLEHGPHGLILGADGISLRCGWKSYRVGCKGRSCQSLSGFLRRRSGPAQAGRSERTRCGDQSAGWTCLPNRWGRPIRLRS